MEYARGEKAGRTQSSETGKAARRPLHSRVAIAAGLLLAMLVASPGEAQEQTYVTLATGGVTGVYYPAGSAICRAINKSRSEHGLRCSAESGGGSIDNLEALRSGTTGFAIVQADWLHHAYRGTSAFSDKEPFEDLRTVAGLHMEQATLVVPASSAARTLADLKGKRVNIGPEGSGSAATWTKITSYAGWTTQDQGLVTRLDMSGQGEALCTGAIDAFFAVIGHPAGLIEETQEQCAIRLIGINGPKVDTLLEEAPYYQASQIPAQVYKSQGPVDTIGTPSMVMTVAAMPDAAVNTLLRAVLGDLDGFRSTHLALGALTASDLLRKDATVPLHHGAFRVYREQGKLQ